MELLYADKMDVKIDSHLLKKMFKGAIKYDVIITFVSRVIFLL